MKNSFSPRDLAQLLGVSESSLKRWVDDGRITAARTTGGHRRIPLPEAIRFIRESRLRIASPALLELDGFDRALQTVFSQETVEDPLYDALVEGRASDARALVLAMHLAGRDVAWIADHPIRQAMHRIGQLWAHHESGICIEHTATDTAIAALNFLRALLPEPPSDAPLALGGAPENDHYAIPSLLAAMSLTQIGWRTANAGPNTPFEQMLAAAERSEASLVWITFSVDQPRVPLDRQTRDLANQLAEQNIALIVGGRACPPALRDAPRMHFGNSMAELAAYASGLLGSLTHSAG